MAEEGDKPEADDRTEAPTPRRLERAREEGQVALSREAVGFASLLLATLATAAALPVAGEGMLLALRGLMARAGHELRADDAWGLSGPVALALLPVALAGAAGAVAAALFQTGGLVNAKALVPKVSHLSPLKGAARLFGKTGLEELARALLKILGVGAALWWAVGDDPARWLRLFHAGAGDLLAECARLAWRLAVAALAALAVLALADVLYVRFRHLRDLRMSRQDLKEEARDTEGDPQVRARRRALRQQRARRRMMAAVPGAAVVVTNPTHYAVALAYQEGAAGSAAPRVVAKGADAVAARIRAAAEGAGVPLVSNPPLARALFRLDLDAEIPPEHYAAVAEIIAFVWRRRRPAAPPPPDADGD